VNEISDASAESESDGEEMAIGYDGTIRPYMFEPTIEPSEAVARDAEKKATQATVEERRFADVSKW